MFVLFLTYSFGLILTHLKGDLNIMPLDWFFCGHYSAGPTTVWQLGGVLFEILHKKPFRTHSHLLNKLKINKRLSKSKPNPFHISHSTYKSVLHHPVLPL
ncbi:hypothetical protein ILYODFUR_023990 [Ilyodon furcidens]|uniref:Protein kinase domain-containing protein n=1 Tax=Ilyodon furcidens TaxID=33524 RepID=A0ABV0SNS6_9TELE